MELVQGIRERRSIRKFKNMPVPHEVLMEIVETAAYAPSWKNTQTARYLVVEDKDVLKKIAAKECMMNFAHNVDILAGAPALVLLTTVKGYSGYERDGSFSTAKEDRWEVFDAGIAAQTFCLAAWEKGLGTVIMGIFDENKIAKNVNLPPEQQIAAIIPIGYPAAEPKAKVKKKAEELLTFI